MAHQYQQSEQSPLILTELTEYKKTTTYDAGHPGPDLGQAKMWWINGIPILLS